MNYTVQVDSQIRASASSIFRGRAWLDISLSPPWGPWRYFASGSISCLWFRWLGLQWLWKYYALADTGAIVPDTARSERQWELGKGTTRQSVWVDDSETLTKTQRPLTIEGNRGRCTIPTYATGGEIRKERLVWLLKRGKGLDAISRCSCGRIEIWRNTKSTTDVRNAFRFRLSLLCITYTSSKHS